jgi:hypothetical protein
VGAETSSKSCEQAIFVDLAPDASVSSDAVLLKIDGFGQWLQRRGAVQGAVRPVLIVVSLVLAQDPPQMVLVPDEGAVQGVRSGIPRSCGARLLDRGLFDRPDLAVLATGIIAA